MNYNITSNVITTDSTDYEEIMTATEESPTTLIHRLHINERQLRTLAVVLSLTGGLALSFALGVGILIYWYSRKYKARRRQLNEEQVEENQTLYTSHITKSDDTTVHVHAEASSSTVMPPSPPSPLVPPLAPPLPPITPTSIPEPSAPTEKEIQIEENRRQHQHHQQQALCHECLIPPPAYTEDNYI